MSRSFNTKHIPGWVLDGIETAFEEWRDMSGEWLQTAPEYLLTVQVAQTLRNAIPTGSRTLLMEPHVAKTLADAGGVQRGPNSSKLRAGGRFDIVLGHGNGRPRTVIEMKNPLWTPMGKATLDDLHRICRALLQGRERTQLYSGVFGLYTSSAQPRAKDKTAKARLERRWVTEWQQALQAWSWAGSDMRRYSSHLNIELEARIHEEHIKGETHAWAAVCVHVTRKPKVMTRMNQQSAD